MTAEKRQCAGDAAFAKLLWPLLRLIMVSLPLPGGSGFSRLHFVTLTAKNEYT